MSIFKKKIVIKYILDSSSITNYVNFNLLLLFKIYFIRKAHRFRKRSLLFVAKSKATCLSYTPNKK